MTRCSKPWSYAVGLAFFAMSLSILVPFSSALAGPNSNAELGMMEICTIGGVKLVKSTLVEETIVPNSHNHAYCIYCGLSNAPLVLADAVTIRNIVDIAKRATITSFVEARLRHVVADIEIRGPPVNKIRVFLKRLNF